MTPTTAGAVTLHNVTRRFAAQLAVENLSLDITPGEFFTILGPSGGGKTTTLAMIAGFETPDEGRIILAGKDMTHAAPRDRNLGMVFQNYAIFPHLDVFENVAFPLRARHAPKPEIHTRVTEALATVQLQGLERRFARQLSGGQQQRVALARAIVARPGIVLMDEPLGALDKNLRDQMQTEIADIQRRLGMTVIFVTHDQEEAMTLSDRIAIMQAGRLIQAGPPRDVYDNPVNAFVARFLGESNLLPGPATGNTMTFDATTLQAANTAQGPALLFVRPEKLLLHPPGAPTPPAANTLPGHVRRSHFRANLIRTELELANGQALVIDAISGPGAQPLPPGHPAQATWPIADSRLLPA